MRKPLIRSALAVAAATTVVLTTAGASSAGIDDGDGSCAGKAPAQLNQPNNSAPVAQSFQASLVSGFTTELDVASHISDANNDQLTLVSASGATMGSTCIDDNRLYYSSEATGGKGGTDTVTYGITDGDYYRSATVTITVQPIASSKPVVKVKRKKVNGKYVPAQVVLTNPDPSTSVEVVAGLDLDDPSTDRVLEPGQSVTMHAVNSKFYVLTFGVDENDDENYGSVVGYWTVATDTGKVTTNDPGRGGYYRAAAQRRAHRAS